MRIQSGKLLMALSLVLSGSFQIGQAHASEPAVEAPRDAEEAYEWSDVVFLGKVTEVHKDDQGFESLASVQISQVWKGKALPSQILVDGSGGPTYPARIFKQDQKYLFYVDYAGRADSGRYLNRAEVEESSYPGGWLRADTHLHRILPVKEATEDLKFLLQIPSQTGETGNDSSASSSPGQ